MSTKPERTAVWVAVLGVAGTLGAAVIANWDKLFGPHDRATTTTSLEVHPDAGLTKPRSQGRADARPDASVAVDVDRSRDAATQPPVCKVTLVIPRDGDELPVNRVSRDKIDVDWQFGWQACPEASKYHLFVMVPGALNAIVNDDSITSATYRFHRTAYGLTRNEGVTWKVRALVDGQWGPWSEERRFDIKAPPPRDAGPDHAIESGR